MGCNLCSIGSTCEELSKRIERHRADDRIYVDGKKLFTTLGKTHEYGQENGID